MLRGARGCVTGSFHHLSPQELVTEEGADPCRLWEREKVERGGGV